MKFYILIVLTLCITTDCKSNTGLPESIEQSVDISKDHQLQETTMISYTTTTRGYYERIWIEGDSLFVTLDRNEEKVSSMPLSEEDLQELQTIIADLPLNRISEIEAPTNKRHGDAARMANLDITIDSKTYESQTFDHGHPPLELERLVNKVLSLRELIEK